MIPPGFQLCHVHAVLFRAGTVCLSCPSVAFQVVHGRSPLEWDRYRTSEIHTCATANYGPCRACAQARVAHDDGDEQPGSFPGRQGFWLVGGGRDRDGTVGP